MIQAYIISIGNELLNGHTADTNGCWLAGKLLEAGVITAGIQVVPDEIDKITIALQQASEQGQLLLVTGGLGPTDDDLTREAVAAYLETELEFHPDVLAQIELFFKQRSRTMASTNRRQAWFPKGAVVLDNPHGTAPGFWCSKGDVHIAAMPGVPSEMKRMFDSHIAPRLDTFMRGRAVVSGKLRCYGVGESTLAEKMGDLMKRDRNPLINCTCGSGDIILHIIAQADSKAAAQKMVEEDKALIREILGDWVYGQGEQSLPVIVGELLKSQGKTIALAESCTGGLLSQLMTEIPGASEYLLAGWVTYSNAAKTECLGVDPALIDNNGAVSEPVARAMAEGAARNAGADVGVGITGIAGPSGGTEQKQVGLVYIGTYYEDKTEVKEYHFPSSTRHFVRLRATLAALNDVRLRMGV